MLRGWAWVSVANRAASTLTVIGIFALGVQLHGKGEISVGAIVSFVGFALMMIGRMEQLAGFISELFFQAPALANFFDVLDARSAMQEVPVRRRCANVRGEVAFEDVSFGYERGAAGAQGPERARARRQHGRGRRARPAPARPPRCPCSTAPTIPLAGASRSMAPTSAP